MAPTEDDIGRVIQAFARAALDPSQWIPAMGSLCEATGAVCCALELADLKTGAAAMECSIDLDTQVLAHYEERIFHINPRVRQSLSLAVGPIVDDRHIMPTDDPNIPEFRDWLKQTPYYYIQGAKVLESDGHIGFFSSNYSEKQGPGEFEQEKIHQIIVPHLINFVNAGRALNGNRLRNDLINASALQQDRPFALLDRAGRIIECSLGFEAVVRTKRLLGFRDRYLVGLHAHHRTVVEKFLSTALHTGVNLSAPMPIRLVGPDCRRGVVLRAVPIAPANDIFDIFRPAALVTITDLDRPFQARRRELVALFGLTAREADVAAMLSEGHSPESAARDLGISAYTVRQHMKAVFGKIGVGRQSELVSVVSRLT